MPLIADISHRIAVKSAIEEILGEDAWYEIKETTSITPWRRNTLKVLKVLRISIAATVLIRDEAWAEQVESNLSRGEADIRASKDIDELLSSFEATLVRQAFLQVGLGVNHKGRPCASFRKENWTLDVHRTVMYVQTPAQVERKFWSEQQQRIGFQAQIDLRGEHRRSKSKLPYSVWCRQRENSSTVT